MNQPFPLVVAQAGPDCQKRSKTCGLPHRYSQPSPRCHYLPVRKGEQRGMADMRVAEQYAARAADAGKLEEVRANLQQALNCLEGPQGPDYRRSVGDPCGGSGVVNELPTGSVNKIRVQKAIRLAAVGVTFHDFDPAHYTALAVRAVLAEGTG